MTSVKVSMVKLAPLRTSRPADSKAALLFRCRSHKLRALSRCMDECSLATSSSVFLWPACVDGINPCHFPDPLIYQWVDRYEMNFFTRQFRRQHAGSSIIVGNSQRLAKILCAALRNSDSRREMFNICSKRICSLLIMSTPTKVGVTTVCFSEGSWIEPGKFLAFREAT